MTRIVTSAPGKIILFGEHSVVYNKLAVATAISRRAKVTLQTVEKNNKIILDLPKYGMGIEITLEQCISVYEEVESYIKNGDTAKLEELNKAPDSPFEYILGYLKPDIKEGLYILIESDLLKNTGSSSACFSAFAAALLELDGKFSKDRVYEASIKGDVISHGGIPSGVDNFIVTIGSMWKYQKNKDPEHIPITNDMGLHLLVIDSGFGALTNKTVLKVAEQREHEPQKINNILNRMEDIALRASKIFGNLTTNKLTRRGIFKLGMLMNENQICLHNLSVSTRILDDITEIALQNGALGAKLTGGGGGGCAIALCADNEKLLELQRIYKEQGYTSQRVHFEIEGVKIEHVNHNS